jgi:hypothetical protein
VATDDHYRSTYIRTETVKTHVLLVTLDRPERRSAVMPVAQVVNIRRRPQATTPRRQPSAVG